jgi:hypothetical protein
MAKEGLADKFIGLLFGRWWAGMLLGLVLIGAGAFVFWGLVEDPGQGAAPHRTGRTIVLSALMAGCGGLLTIIGVLNLFAGNPKDGSRADKPQDESDFTPNSTAQMLVCGLSEGCDSDKLRTWISHQQVAYVSQIR